MGLYFFLKVSKSGQAIRATAQDSEAAQQMGVPVNRVNATAFALASALGGLAGVLVGLYYNTVSPAMGFQAGLKGFTACVLGGLGSVPGAMAGGLVLGVTESLGVAAFGSSARGLVAFALLLAALVLRPQGVFSWKKKSLPPEPLTGTFLAAAKAVRVPWPMAAGLLGLAALVPLVFPNPYLLQVLTNGWIMALFAVSLTLLAGTTGILSLGHAGLMALGAYTSGAADLAPWLALRGGLHRRRRGRRRVGNAARVPGAAPEGALPEHRDPGPGRDRQPGHPQRRAAHRRCHGPGGSARTRGVRPSGELHRRLLLPDAGGVGRGGGGRRLDGAVVAGPHSQALREDETAATALGVRPGPYRAWAFAIAGFFAGWAGALSAHLYSYISHETFNAPLSILGLTMVIAGGLGNVGGAVLGAVSLSALPEILRPVAEYRPLVYGLLLLVALRWRPQGALGSV